MAEPTDIAPNRGGRRIESGSWVATFRPEQGLSCEFSPAVAGRPQAVADLLGEPAQRALAPDVGGRGEARIGVLFDGLLHNRRELARELDLAPETGEIDLLRAAYRRWGDGLPARLDGVFAMLLWDTEGDALLAATDHLSSVPLYYAERGSELVFSPALGEVVSQPRVPATVDRVVLAERLQHRFHSAAETCYAAVRCLPPGHSLTVARGSRGPVPYWEPSLPEQFAGRGRDEFMERFQPLFERAVRRCIEPAPSAVMLSGGLDSVAVAEAAVTIARREGLAVPRALSFYVPGDECASEREIQESVARQLGMSQTMVGPGDAEAGLLAVGLACSRRSPSPTVSIWWAMHRYLHRDAADHGCGVVLSGGGGDEWLGLNFALAADLLATGRWRALGGLRRTVQRSSGTSWYRSARQVIWTYGLRLLAREALIRGAGAAAPTALDALRRRRAVRREPVWLADEPQLRCELRARAVERMLRRERGGFHRRDRRQMLRRPLQTILRRQAFHLASRSGVRFLEPFWDRELVEFLAAASPEMLMDGDRSKAPIRARLAARFPELGFAGQKKYDYEGFVYGHIRQASRELGVDRTGTPALADAGIADDARMRSWIGGIHSSPVNSEVHYLWTVLSTEAWLQTKA